MKTGQTSLHTSRVQRQWINLSPPSPMPPLRLQAVSRQVTWRRQRRSAVSVKQQAAGLRRRRLRGSQLDETNGILWRAGRASKTELFRKTARCLLLRMMMNHDAFCVYVRKSTDLRMFTNHCIYTAGQLYDGWASFSDSWSLAVAVRGG